MSEYEDIHGYTLAVTRNTREQDAALCEHLGAQGYGSLYIAAAIRAQETRTMDQGPADIPDIPLDLALEDEAFKELERQAEHKRYTRVLQKAQTEAARFVQEQQTDLAIMTLRKAFEIGYRFGFADAWQEKK